MSSEARVSSSGFTLPYKRYLGDAASGMLLVGALAWLWAERMEESLSRDAPTVIALLGFMLILAPAVGLVFNATSWFVLGSPQLLLEWWFVRRCAAGKRTPGTGATALTSRFCSLVNQHRFPTEERHAWFERSGRLQAELRARNHQVVERLEYVEGGRSLARNLSLASLVAAVGHGVPLLRGGHWFMDGTFWGLLVFAAGSLYVAGLIGFYYETELLDRWDAVTAPGARRVRAAGTRSTPTTPSAP